MSWSHRTTGVGDRIKLVYCSDPYTQLVSGDKGTVTDIDDAGTVHVEWDSGSRLGLVPGEDRWVALEP